MPPDFKSFLNSGRPAADYFGNSAPDPYIDFLNGGKPAAEFYAPEPEPEPEPVPEPIPEPVAAPVEGPAPLTQADMPSPFSPFGQAQVQDTAPTLSAESKDQINLDAASIDANLEGDDRTRFKRNVTDPLTKSGYGLGTVAAATRASHAAQNLVKIQAYQDARASGDEAATARALARLNENPVKAQDPEFLKERREFWLERLAEESASSAQRRDKQEGIKSHPAVEHAMAGSSGSFFRTLGSKHFMSLIWGLAAESAAYMVPSLALGGAAGLGLKAAGTTAQMLGFAGGTGTGSFWVDSNFTMLEAMADAGVDITDSQSLIKAFQDESIMADAREKGLKKGLAVGIFDAISGGIATKLMVPKSMLLSSPFRRQAVNVPAQLGAQAVLGGTGEALGQKVAYGEVQNWVEVYAEAIAELGTAPLEVATAAYSAGSGAEAIARAKLKKAGIDVASIDIEDPEYMEDVRFGLWLEVEADLAQTKKGQSLTVEERELKSAYIVEDMLRAVLPQYADHVDSMEAAAGEIVAAAKERKALTGGPQKQAPITAEDEASPIDSDLIAEGTAIQNDVAAGTPDIAPADPSPLIDDAPLVTPDPTISLKNDGSPFPTKPAAWVAAKSRKDLRGRTLEVVEVEGGFGLREPVVSQTEAEADPPLAPAQQDLSGTPPTVQTAPAAQPSSGGEAVVAGEPTDYAAMGKKAFEDGLPAEPPADVIAGGVPAITAWGDAWMKANVAALVPGVTDPATLAQDKIDQEARTKEILGDNYRVPELKHGENSWVVVERGTLNSVLEITERATADKINQEKYEVLTAGDYLGRKNAETKKDNTQKGPVMGEPAAETIDLTETPEQVVERRVDEIYNEPDNAKSKEQIRGELQNSPAESADNPTEKPETKKPQEPAKADNPPEKLKTPKPELPAKESTTKPVESNETPPVKDKADYGADNKLVTAERAEELRKKLSAKFKSQLGSGIDPEMLAMGTELAVFHIESGTRKFVSLAQKMAESMGITLEQLRPYLRSWYNGARDMIEDSGGNVDNMDTADEVRAALKTLGQESPEDTADKAPPAVEKTKPKKANRVRGKKIDREPQTILQAIASYGGMNDKDGWIEEAGHLNNFQPAFGKPFKKTGGMQIVYIIEQLIADRFLPEGSESPALYEAIDLAARKLVEGRRPEDVAEVEEDPDQKRAEMEALAEDYGLNSKDLTDEKLEQLIDNYLESIEADGDYMEHEGDIGYDPHPQEQDDEIPFESDTDGNNAPEGENGDARGEQAGIVPGTESGGAQNGTHKQETEAGDKPATAETETVDTVDGPRPQGIIPGAKGSNQQLVDSKGDKLKTKKEQDEPGGMFGETTKEKVAKRDKENEAGQGNLLTPGDQNAPSSNADLERDSEVSSSDGVRQEDVSAPGSADGRGAGERGDQANQSGDDGLRGTAVASNDGAPSLGTGSNSGIRQGQSGEHGGATQSGDSGRGPDISGPRAPNDRGTTDPAKSATTKPLDLKAKREAQKKANSVEIIEGDADNIAASLPFLFPEQHDDVLKAERRFAAENGHGMMFTNGTGTGKTYTGAGIIARQYRQGRENILVVAPTQGVVNAWIEAFENLGIPVSRLDGVAGAGTGLVVTTYANLGQNQTLADREWDFVAADESHKLMSSQDGKVTEPLKNLRAITNHPQGLRTKAYTQEAALVDALKTLQEAKAPQATVDAAWAELDAAIQKRIEEYKLQPRAKALFLSATPFAYVKTVDYANGYLFEYNQGFDDSNQGGYNQPDAQDAFYMRHFGYRMRTGKLTRPDGGVNLDVMERGFHEWLVTDQKSLSGRRLDIEPDYDRKFILIEDGLGNRIDEAMKFLNEADDGKFRVLGEMVQKKFDYISRQQLLEAIKAQHSVQYIKDSIEAGRKVVVFHDFNVGGGFNPFALDGAFASDSTVTVGHGDTAQEFNLQSLYDEFLERNPYVNELKFADMLSPIETMQREFPNALLYNGRVSKGERARAMNLFNTDSNGYDLIVIQSAAGEAGISLHDTTGIHRRTLVNLGMPSRPVTAIQEEGRVYREGQVTDAAFRYFNTGTTWERYTFADKIAERSSTAENLALGDNARALKQSFIEAFLDSDTYPVSEEDGKGGKEADRQESNSFTPWERAKTYYYAQQKKSGRRDQREGIDYFATPEPVGFKMVEFADIKVGEKVLEPSAGHGAIARFLPETSIRTIVEPSMDLSSRAAMATPGAKVVSSRFEDLNIINKYDAIIMNPPYGSGGATAVAHVEKAVKHLKNGGRIVALIPTGPAADKKFAAFYEAVEDVYIVADVAMPSVTFKRAGTSVMTKIIVLEKQADEDVAEQLQQRSRDYTNAETVEELFDRMEDTDLGTRLEPLTKDIDVEPNEDGTITAGGNEYKITVDEAGNSLLKPKKFLGSGEFRRVAQLAEKNGGFYDSGSKSYVLPNDEAMGEWLAGIESGETVKVDIKGVEGVDFTTAETNHAKKNIPLFVASLNSRVEREEYTRLNQIAKQNNGYYSKFSRNGAIPGFQFETEADREAFLAVASKGGDEATPQFSRRHSDPSDNVGKGGVTVTGEFSDAATTDLLNDLVAALKKIDPRGHIALRLKKTISAVIDGEVEFMDGQYLRGLIEVALDAKKDKGWVLNHEVIHALRKLGVIRESEWTALSKAVLRNKARMDDVRERSTGQNLSEEKLIEEAIADLFADFQAGNVDKKGFERTAWDRVVEFFNALGDLLIGKGFNTIDSIFNRIASGEVGMRNTDAELAADAAMDGDSFMRRGTPTQNRAINKITDVTDHRPLMERIMDTGANLWEDAKNEWVWATADNALGQRQMGLALNPEAADRELASYVAASLASHNAGQMEAMIRWGAPYWDSEYGVMRQDDTGGLYTILEPIFSGNLEGLFNGYAYARRVRAQKLIREGREHNLTEADVEDLLSLGEENPELVEVFDKLQVYMKKVLDMAEDMGLINDKQRNGDPEKGTVGWENMDYVPFYRHIEEGSGVTGPRRTRGLTGQSAGIKRLTGGKKLWGVIEDSTGSVMGRFEKKSEANALRKKLGKTTHEVEAMGQPIPSIVENIAKNITHLVDASMKNVAAVLAIDEGLELGIIEKVGMARIRALVPTSAAVSTLKKQGLAIDGDLEKVSSITAMAAIADPVKLGNNIVSIRRDGKVEYYEVHNRIVYKSIGQLYRQEMSGYILTPLIYTKTFFTRSITAFPAFMARNFGRDSGSSWLISEERSNNFYKEMWASMKALTISMDDPQVRELMAAGGDVGFYQNAPKDILKQLRQMERDNKLVHLLNPLELFMRTFRAWEHHVGRRGELANRNVTFKRVKDATKGDIRQGAFAAGDLMDFYKRGGSDLAVLLTSISPFLNARIQGLYKLARVGGRAAVKEGLMKKLMIKGGMMVGFTVAMALINMGDEGWDEDEELPAASGYNDLPEYVKDASWVINYWRILGRRNAMKVGLPQFGYIPKPFEIGAIFGTIPERMLQSIVGNDRSSASKQAMINLIMNTFAINPASNPWLLTPIELFANKDSFRDTPIESMSMENLPPEMRYNDRTSYLAKEAGKATGLSPAKIEHVVKGFTATLGDYILAASDAISDTIIGGAPPKASKRLDERNIIKSFVGQAPMRSTKWTDRFFELKKEISQQYSGLQKIKDDEGAVEYRRQSLLPENKGVGADMRKMNRVAKKLKKIRDEQTKINRSLTMTPDEKRSELDVLLSERNLLVKQETQRMEAKADKRDSLR